MSAHHIIPTFVSTEEERQRCFAIRMEVFVHEQKVPVEEEIDIIDSAPSTSHLLVTVDGEDAGTGRLLIDGAGHLHIGRVAVYKKFRGIGVGRVVMTSLADHARGAYRDQWRADADFSFIEISAQEQAIPFYEGVGYVLVPGERYLDAGIWHRDMRLAL